MTGCAEQFKEGGNWMDEERSKVRVMSEEEKEQYDGVTIIEGTVMKPIHRFQDFPLIPLIMAGQIGCGRNPIGQRVWR